MGKIPTFIKWAGGKSQLLEQFKPLFPKKIERYFEPFVGGGAVAFYILKNYQPKYVMISDINSELINAYDIIKRNPKELVVYLDRYKKAHSRETYYNVRAKDPNLLNDVEKAGRFIYLNKTCFNGLHRVNSKGKFNVPMGSYKNPAIFYEEDIMASSVLLQNVELNFMPFEKIIDYAKNGDFVYLDPPYYPLKKGKSFTTYTKQGFNEKEQIKLAKIFKKLDKKGCNVMLSNSDTGFVKSLYGGYNFHTLNAKRMINSDAKGRGAITELAITNYLI